MSRWLRLDERHTPETAAALYRVLEARVRAVPGITAFALADGVKQSDLTSIRVPGQAPRPVTARSVSTEYFQALGIPIVAGRALAPGESGVAVISEHLARGLWPGESALGKTMDDPDRGTLLVVGIAKTLPESYFNGTPLQLYRPFHARARSREMVIRFEGDTRSSIRGVSAALRDVFPGVVPAPETLRAQVDAAAHEFRVVAGLLFAVGVVIILLAVIGIYGVIAFSVRQRARELGIRVALGARSLEIVRLLCVSGMRPVWIGLAAGLALAIAGAQVVEQAFSGSGIPMHAGDPLAYLGGGLLIVGASAAAMAGPAFRAAHTDPVEALRHD
jgi:ABC-type antimicrobial peptide transport system permease subunit